MTHGAWRVPRGRRTRPSRNRPQLCRSEGKWLLRSGRNSRKGSFETPAAGKGFAAVDSEDVQRREGEQECCKPEGHEKRTVGAGADENCATSCQRQQGHDHDVAGQHPECRFPEIVGRTQSPRYVASERERVHDAGNRDQNDDNGISCSGREVRGLTAYPRKRAAGLCGGRLVTRTKPSVPSRLDRGVRGELDDRLNYGAKRI